MIHQPNLTVASLSSNAESGHPVWCQRAACAGATSDGHHFSRAVVLQPIAPSPLGIAVQLMQGKPIDGFPLSNVPMVAMTFTDGEGDWFTPLLYLSMARRLGRMLSHYPAVR